MGTAKPIGLIIKINYEYNKTSPRILCGNFLKLYNLDSFIPKRMPDHNK